MRSASLKFIIMLFIILVFFILNVSLGSVYIPISDIINIFLGSETGDSPWRTIVLDTRLPQAITAILAGSALGVAGLMMQTLFRNPLAGPSVLGVTSGASLGVALLMLLAGFGGGKFVVFNQVSGNFSVIIAAFLGALGVLLLIGILAGRVKSNTVILIIGIMIAYAVTAIVGVLQFYSLKEDLQAFVIWGLGSFANVSWNQMKYFLPVVTGGLLFSAILIKPLNILLLGENYAQNLGIHIKRTRILIIVITGVLAATVTAYCGPIAFLGLAIPHLSRNFFQTSDHMINLPGVILAGSLLALVCSLIARLPGMEGALPINAITSLIGAPIVVWIVIKRSKFKAEV
nr:iron ABC transporter permease [Bacteroidota bacterium]